MTFLTSVSQSTIIGGFKRGGKQVRGSRAAHLRAPLDSAAGTSCNVTGCALTLLTQFAHVAEVKGPRIGCAAPRHTHTTTKEAPLKRSVIPFMAVYCKYKADRSLRSSPP